MLDCPRKAWYRYVERVPAPKGVALIKGTACDLAWNDALVSKLGGVEMEVEELLTRTETYFREDVAKEGGPAAVNYGDKALSPKVAARAALDSSMRMAEVWHRDLYPAIEPAAVQLVLERPLPSGRLFTGVIDWTGTIGIHAVDGDNKTGSDSMSQSEADKATQASAYSWLREAQQGENAVSDDGELLYQFVFARGVDTKTPKAEFVHTYRTLADNEWYGQMVVEVEAQFMAGNFPPNPKSNLCSPKWCPFYAHCMPHKTQHAGA